MCFAKSTSPSTDILEVPYMENADDFVQHLMATFFYLVELPNVGDYHDGFEGHVIMFGDLEIIFFTQDY